MLHASRLTSIGVQLFSVRDQLGTDPDSVIAALARIGYSELEPWFPDNNAPTAEAIKKSMVMHGMKAPSRHCRNRDLEPENIGRLFDECKILDSQYVVLASLLSAQWTRQDDCKRAADRLNQFGQACRDHGLRFAFHTEPPDFRTLEGIVPFEFIVEHTDPSLVRLQLDVANITKGKRSPVEYIEQLGRRIFSLHLKDLDGAGDWAELGTGVVPIREILRLASAAGVSSYIIEDARQGLGFSHVEADFNRLRSIEI